MAVNMFLRASGITGESQDAGHKGWTDLISLSWGASQPGSMATGGGGGVGRVNFNDLTVIAMTDKATPALLQACASGKHLNKVEVSVCKAGGKQMESCAFILEDVLITGVTFGGAEGGTGMRYAFQAAKVHQHYREQTASGGRGPESLTGWNIKANCEI